MATLLKGAANPGSVGQALGLRRLPKPPGVAFCDRTDRGGPGSRRRPRACPTETSRAHKGGVQRRTPPLRDGARKSLHGNPWTI